MTKQSERYTYSLKTIRILGVAEDGMKQDLSSPQSAVDVARGIFATLDQDQEHLILFACNAKNRITGFKVLFSGGQDFSQCDMKVLFRNALMLGATSILIAHNHPSGDPDPSQEDKRLTRSVAEGAKLLEIRLLDHVIIGSAGYFSFQENRLL